MVQAFLWEAKEASPASPLPALVIKNPLKFSFVSFFRFSIHLTIKPPSLRFKSAFSGNFFSHLFLMERTNHALAFQ
jgi:hypothetical protein